MFEATNLSFDYASRRNHPVLKDLSFRIGPSEFVSLMGPSGSGKTTLSRLLAGHLKPTSGSLHLGKEEVSGKPGRRVFLIHQENDLFPWLRVRDQVRMILELGRGSAPALTRDALRIETARILELVRLSHCEDLFPSQISGGMKKRLAIARAVALRPDLLILDEAFTSLDLPLKEDLSRDLQAIWSRTGTSLLFISHDPGELSRFSARRLELVPHPSGSGHTIRA